MALLHARSVVALLGCGSLALALQLPADGAVVTTTTITTPSGTATYLYDGGPRTMTVAGTASSDVAKVWVYCLRGPAGQTDATTVASNVSVTNGAFSTTVAVPNVGNDGPVCRLRALPQGVKTTDDQSAYAGPVVHLDRLDTSKVGSTVFDFDLSAGSGTGELSVESAGKCGDKDMGNLSPDLANPQDFRACVADLGPGAAAGSTGSLRVDGHLALLPYSVFAFGDAEVALDLKVHPRHNGTVTWTEHAPLVRCRDTDTYPPPSGQCDAVVATGVTFTRAGTFTAGGHQVRLRDSFASADGQRHRVRTVYGMEWTPPPTGALGFAFPGRAGGFHASTAGQVVTGLPRKASTFLVRSDRFAGTDDPLVSTRAVTWSRTPSRLAFAAGDASVFGMSYTLTVPKHGAARLGFTDSTTTTTSSARAMGVRAAAAMMPAPRITSPRRGGVVTGKKTVVKGTLRAGVNGLPVSIKVNGHPATITVRSATRATYKVVFDEALGKHTLTAVARDAGGNTRSTSIKVRNR